MKTKIAIITGGTGGHVFPAIALSEQLKIRDIEHVFMADYRVLHLMPKESTYLLNIKPNCNKLHKKIVSAYSIIAATKKTTQILKKEKPDALVSFGGYATIPAVLAAKHLKIPTILHEQNTVLGSSHKIFAKQAAAIAISFSEVERLKDKTNIVHTGNPVRKSILDLNMLNNNNYNNDKNFNILILGGSQGSQEIDQITSNILTQEINNYKINIVHQCRPENIKKISAGYTNLGIANDVSHFFNNIGEKIAKANLVICRAGATTIAENLAANKPAIYIPYKHASHNHQMKNAQFVVKNGAGLLFEQNAESLIDTIKKLLNQPMLLANLSVNAKNIAMPNASAQLAELTLKHARLKQPV
ncbi:UDP-N-acetylglucosamine--N-acetylmuramyl-(pentapeptide) pyrophosphoryl-undecaprenol N-acetylglucosamine transferase [Candidatus Xenohaliotis californiensis]|uniref:UDP-N-acetylglucosamine--N-acetylmuramyl-(pentapeptide) pyrophosphoryl-undecaprenol N-acetylglucosamine transferase n=1 Tax=Candidatus Xenohaliotis californiensis TaxID=84677 RepID=A0ABM9N7C1_9RICK|nr:UDP-N-acetylglucosamine--N-acetylmuramyl-(pentapeptide) pyrophosphoryl-undecaprenol N-acetylglucosamine transferase [Candidatus Xenohaliotis californiensis]